MALRINTNSTALTAFRNLSNAQGALNTSIERLSSGLRINHAQDDPAGMAIAEKIRTQVKGLARASMNAQDGISVLQTADSALGEVQGILQRIRELAIQAANGTLTSNDRVQIQAEVDQLLKEIDRTAAATEFNTKKLLDGTTSALVSTDSPALTPMITGDKAVDRNYTLQIDNKPGQGEVLKSDIFRIVAGDQYKDGNRGLVDDIVDATPVVTTRALNSSDFTLWQNTSWSLYHDNGVPGFAASPNTNQDFQGTLALGAATDQFGVADAFIQNGRWTGFTATGGVLDATGATDSAPYVVVEVAGVQVNNAIAGAAATLNGDTLTVDTALNGGNGTAQFVQYKVTTYDRLGTVVSTVNPAAQDVGLAATGWTAAAYDHLTNTFGLANYTGTTMTLGSDGDKITVGDKFVLLYDNLTQYGTSGQLNTAQDGWQGVGTTSDNGTYTLFTGATVIGLGDPGEEINRVGARVAIPAAANAQAGLESAQSVAWLDTSGRFHVGTGNTRLGDVSSTVAAGSFTYNMFESTLAERVTELQWVDRFQSGGRSLFAQSAQNLTIYSNSRSKQLVLEAKDTVGDVAEKFRQAIASSVLQGGLDMAVDGLINTPTGVDYNTSVFVDNPVAQTDEAVGGTIVLRSTIGGQEGRFFFAGDERLVNGFSWATVKGATFGTMNVSVFDAHSGEWLGDQKVSDGVLRNMLPGVDVAMNGKTDTLITWNAAAGTFTFASGPGKATQHVHVANNAMTLQVGANAGQSIDALVGEVTSSSLELQRLLLVDRDVAEESLGKIDKAVNQVNSQRARIGAYMSRLNTTINILDITNQNMSASESRIRDLDVAQETIAYTRNQIMSQAATAVLAQANQLPQTVLTLLR